jgi:hypothetical protein
VDDSSRPPHIGLALALPETRQILIARDVLDDIDGIAPAIREAIAASKGRRRHPAGI